MRQQNDSLSLHFARTPENFLKILCVTHEESTAIEWSFSCIRQIHNWLRNSILEDLLGDLVITAMHGHRIFYLETDISIAYMSIHPPRMMTLLISDFLQNLNQTTGIINGRVLFLLNCKNFETISNLS